MADANEKRDWRIYADFAQILIPEPGSIYVMDRGYVDFGRLHAFTRSHTSFVIRAKKNLRFVRRYSAPVEKSTGLICDHTIVLTVAASSGAYPDALRRIRYKDPETGKTLVFLTNHFALPALTITELYRSRWKIELFFKWIKQHLRIKAFYGTSENAVKTQIRSAISTYVLVAILKKRLGTRHSLYTILQIPSVALFEKVPVAEAFSVAVDILKDGPISNQLQLFEL